MVVARLMGGLGNQMFQYAAARRLSIVRGTELVLDLGWFRDEAAAFATPRAYALDRFQLPVRSVSLPLRTIQRWEAGIPVRAGRRLGRRKSPLVIRQVSGTAHLDRRVLDAPDESLLIGYWQSERYFADVADTIRADLSDPTGALPGRGLPEDLDDPCSVALHVRRGDYVSHPRTAAVHGVLPPAYYREALSLLARRLGRVRVFVFSDDPDWVGANGLAGEPVSVLSSGNADPLDELMLMRRCRHHVIANSSFSWWGAWLCEHPDKIVVAPRCWFRDLRIDTADLVPATWIRM